MNAMTIALVTFGYFEPSLIENVIIAVQNEYHCTVIQKDAFIDLSDFFDSSRRQYHGDKILKSIMLHQVHSHSKVIGLLQVDLFIPILTFIFGQAQLNGTYGIASSYRLNSSLYGMPRDDEKMVERFIKEIIHEIGHTFGLIHCLEQQCVMRSSTYVEDIDQKEKHLCTQCRLKLMETLTKE
jgi:archaemetzincin